jgi:hypothetical protein
MASPAPAGGKKPHDLLIKLLLIGDSGQLLVFNHSLATV